MNSNTPRFTLAQKYEDEYDNKPYATAKMSRFTLAQRHDDEHDNKPYVAARPHPISNSGHMMGSAAGMNLLNTTTLNNPGYQNLNQFVQMDLSIPSLGRVPAHPGPGRTMTMGSMGLGVINENPHNEIKYPAVYAPGVAYMDSLAYQNEYYHHPSASDLYYMKDPYSALNLQANSSKEYDSTSSPHYISTDKDTPASKWTTLEIASCKIHHLALELFEHYTFLTYLNISSNFLPSIPSEISSLKNLVGLDVSNNKLDTLPAEVGDLRNLRDLFLHNNNLTSLPYTLGKLIHLERLEFAGNPLSKNFAALLAKTIPETLSHLLSCCEFSDKAPDRVFVELNQPTYYPISATTAPFDLNAAPSSSTANTKVGASIYSHPQQRHDSKPTPQRTSASSPSFVPLYSASASPTLSMMASNVFKIMTYNILSDKYTTSSIYRHCPSWALAWEYRWNAIFAEISEYQADIVCLQEVKTEYFHSTISSAMHSLGYKGIFVSKADHRGLSQEELKCVDGCATYYRTSKFDLVHEHRVHFNIVAPNYGVISGKDMFDRVMRRENVTLVAILKSKIDPTRKICVSNAHLYWNPEYKDVKLVQAIFMIDEVAKFLRSHSEMGIPTIFCGDFNSTYNSGVYELLSQGAIGPNHSDLEGRSYGDITERGYKSPFKLSSAYTDQMPFTNYALNFQGTIDYIWFSNDSLNLLGVLASQPESFFEKNIACPNPYVPSDHLPLLSEFEWKLASNKSTRSTNHT